MSFSTPEPVASGRPYRVQHVAGRPPQALADFVGDAEFGIDDNGVTHRVSGVGAEQGDSVRFHQKDVDRDGKDVRVWRIRRSDDGGFVAEHESPA